MTLQKVLLGNGETISYRERDDGEQVIVLVHGNMTSSKHWDILIDELDSKYKLYALDLRGFGESSYHTRVQGIEDFAHDLKGFVDALGLDAFHLVGWSTGGAVCMQFVVEYPSMCKKLVLLASASTRGYSFYGTNADGTPDMQRRLKTIEEVENDAKTKAIQWLYDTNNREGLKSVWNALIYTHKQPDETKYEEYVTDMLTQRNLADVYYSLNRFNISGIHNGLIEGSNKAKNILIPVLVLRGDRDFVVSQQMTLEIVEDLGNVATYNPLINSGHSPLIDDLSQLTQQIEAFLE